MEKAAKENGRPFWSPTLIGCAMAIHKNYFNGIGAFDKDLRFWGGENIELAFRVWMCGGSVVTLPCSRVGHYFKELPYKGDPEWKKSWQKNLMRIAEIWMDDYKRYYYTSTSIFDSWRSGLLKGEQVSLDKRMKTLQKLDCNTFEWYLNNVIPEIGVPPGDSAYYGEIMNLKSQACWELYEGGYVGLNYRCYTHKILYQNVFSLNKAGILTYKDKCVLPDYPTPALRIKSCVNITQPHVPKWTLDLMDAKWGTLKVNIKTSKGIDEDFCIWQATNSMDIYYGEQMPQLIKCSDEQVTHNPFARWSFTYNFNKIV